MISVKNISKTFDQRLILDGISTEIKKGEVVCIIGPSGSGKSTFLRCLNRLEEVDGGSIFFEGQEVTSPDCKIEEIRRSMGMVFQQFNLFPHLTVKENIILAPTMLGVLESAEAEKKAAALLERVGLADKLAVYPSTLSGGQKQRVAIARALAMNPHTILFDEPTSALDPEMVGEVLAVMQDLAADGMTMIIVTHQMHFAAHVASRIFFIDQGKIAVDGPPDEVFNHPMHPRLVEFLSKVRQGE